MATVYLGLILAALGLVSVAVPLRVLGIRNRLVALIVLPVGILVTIVGMTRPAPDQYAVGDQSGLDEFSPVYQFSESFSIPVRATAGKIFAAIHAVTADEIPFYRTLTWIRRGAAGGPESILNPPTGVPLVEVATRTSFLKLSETPNRELVIGSVVLAPAGVLLATGSTPESYKALTQPGFAKAVMNFSVREQAPGSCLLSTATRVFATDDTSRAQFARYWRFIAPGSATLRLMWLRAIKVRAESMTPG